MRKDRMEKEEREKRNHPNHQKRGESWKRKGPRRVDKR